MKISRDDCIKMAKEAGFTELEFYGSKAGTNPTECLERFAALVAEYNSREWQALTDQEIESLQRVCIDPVDSSGWGFLNRERYARAIEAALKEKNHE